jgi:hypothetical protein
MSLFLAWVWSDSSRDTNRESHASYMSSNSGIYVIDRVGGWVASLRKRQPTLRRETAKGKGSETEGPGNDDVVISNHLPVSGNFSFHSAAIRRWWRWRRRLVGPIPRKLFSQRWRKESLVLLSLCVVKSTTRGMADDDFSLTGSHVFQSSPLARVPENITFIYACCNFCEVAKRAGVIEIYGCDLFMAAGKWATPSSPIKQFALREGVPLVS